MRSHNHKLYSVLLPQISDQNNIVSIVEFGYKDVPNAANNTYCRKKNSTVIMIITQVS